MAGFSFEDGNESGDSRGGTGSLEGASSTGPGQDSGIGSGTSDNKGQAGGTVGQGGTDPNAIAGTVAKKRGRKAYPRDPITGEIIRPDGTRTADTNKGGKVGLAVDGFVLNDRVKVRQQIQGMHAAAAMLTKQAVFLLHDTEADALTNALCDVCDYHKMNLTQKGGVYGLYITLAVTLFGIYKPRIDIVLSGGQVVGVAPTAPSNENEAKERKSGAGMMDFSADTTG